MTSKVFQTVVFANVFLLSSLPNPGHGQDFGYDGNDGPSHWGEKYQHCVGKHQSPINIQEHDVQHVNLSPMIFKNFDWKPNSAVLKNNGHTVVITLDTDKKPTITGGPLIENYEFVQLHFHWGANDEEGSENTINNSSFPLELHMVFFQAAYGSLEAATEHPDGLTVLSFLYSSSKEENVKYKSLLGALPTVQNPNTTTTLQNPPVLKDLIAEDRSVYFTYGGSLTTPPCSEVVTWIEFKNTVPLAHEQIEVFRQLNSEHGKLVHNFRPVQPLYGRTIRMNRDVDDNTLFSTSNRKSLFESGTGETQKSSASNISIKYVMFIFTLLLLSRR